MTFEEFYAKEYLVRHADRRCRQMHLLGLLASVVWGGVIFWQRSWLLLPLLPLPCYALSWVGHLFAGNKPTVYVHPYWSFLAYWRMLGETALGRLTVKEPAAPCPADLLDDSPSERAAPSRQPG